MAVAIIFDGVGITQAQYEQVLNEVAPGGKLADGLISHIAGPSADGICVVDIWESEEVLQAQFEAILAGAIAKAGITIQPKMFRVTNQLP